MPTRERRDVIVIGKTAAGEDLAFPVAAAASRFVIVGKSRAGKTNGDVVLVESFIPVGVPTLVFDRIGNMWGMRSSADGEHAGLPIAIFGGLHGDVDLRADRAVYLADLCAEGVSAVFDLSMLDEGEMEAFTAAFLPRFQRKVQMNMHVLFEEADGFAPERGGVASKAHAKVQSATTIFARTAANHGIGWTFSTQRPQLLHKDVIDSASAFIAMKMTGELAQGKVGKEASSRIGKALTARIMGDLPNLRRGEAWFIPDRDWLGDEHPESEPVKFRFRLRSTFDSARPPRVGERRREPRVLADVDLKRIAAVMRQDVGDVAIDETSEPALLRRRVDELTAMLEDLQSRPAPEPVKVPVWPEAAARNLEQALGGISRAVEALQSVSGDIRAALDFQTAVEGTEAAKNRPSGRPERSTAKRKTAQVPAIARPSTRGEAPPASPGNAPKAGAVRMLHQLARCGGTLTKQQLATLAQVNRSSGTFSDYLRVLKEHGFVQSDTSTVTVLEAGARYAGVAIRKTPPSTSEIVTIYGERLKAGARRMLDLLIGAYPHDMSKEDLANQAGVNRGSGTFSDYLRALRVNGLTHDVGRNRVKASDTLFVSRTVRRRS